MGNKNRTSSRRMAFGGVMAALAATIMSMGTLIPLATYVCPAICIVILQIVLSVCGSRTSWAWYGAVSLLSLLFAPDKEAAVVFVFLGYYPIVKPKLDRRKGKWFWKLLLFNGATLLAYGMMIYLLGLEGVSGEFQEMGIAMTAILLLLGNLTFLLLDVLLERRFGTRRRTR